VSDERDPMHEALMRMAHHGSAGAMGKRPRMRVTVDVDTEDEEQEDETEEEEVEE
jgi:hypothetical protein